MAQLTLDNISKHYGDHAVVDEISLAIEKGQFVALLGPSGCGKTTTLRMIAGFEQLDTGRILLNDILLASPEHHTEPERRNMSMVFQSYALWPHKTVLDNAGYTLSLKGVRGQAYRDQVFAALETVNLGHLADRYPQALSGGQRQRAALARCLVSHPEVVLLDEPLANLDVHLRASMEATFRQFHDRTGATFIYVTHDQAEAMAMADRIAVMNHGRLEQWDTPENLYRRPASRWVATFIGKGSVLDVPSHVHGKHLRADDIGNLLSNAGAMHRGAMLVRPEDVTVVAEGARVTVRHRVYQGERYQYIADLADGQPLTFYHSRLLDHGQIVQVQIAHAWGLDL
ncbi:ABC transporter ATP-binding protein [Advenella kashmirensis W13003]|uniref:ABC transporter ATP-binding protein n=1 Tax=Advenella kashmirensis W13003 TaxID=1424334 RepID=V8QV57_9BURK|nr:ABC transporter ATP-binding protein [Advenella kashmirensis]ETF02884.1 ABC transporter ATP-binding protein [Advenella kashmirensis W13003]